MANKEYTIQVQDGIDTTVLLSDEDAKARGLTGGKSAKPADKQASPADKSASSSKRDEAASKAHNG